MGAASQLQLQFRSLCQSVNQFYNKWEGSRKGEREGKQWVESAAVLCCCR